MTAVEVMYRYGLAPGTREMRSLDKVREVYGIRKMTFNERERTVRIEYDATRLGEATVAALLRDAGVDVKERLELV